MVFTLYNILFLFFIYSFLGWCVEVAFVAVTVGKVENRGFLNGSLCPIYGCGMLGVLALLLPIGDNLIFLFLGGVVICTAIEFFAGWILDKIFHMRWWDYSDKPFNVGGYVCPEFSIMWGLGVVFVIRIVHPGIMSLVDRIPLLVGKILLSIFIIVFIIDLTVTVKNLMGIRKSLNQLDKIAEEMRNVGDRLKDVIGNSAIDAAEMAGESMEKIEVKEKLENLSDTTKERWGNISDTTRERWENISESARDRFEKQMEELQEKREELISKTLKRSGHRLNKLPVLHREGKNINIKEYLNMLKGKGKDKK